MARLIDSQGGKSAGNASAELVLCHQSRIGFEQHKNVQGWQLMAERSEGFAQQPF